MQVPLRSGRVSSLFEIWVIQAVNHLLCGLVASRRMYPKAAPSAQRLCTEKGDDGAGTSQKLRRRPSSASG